MDIRERMEDFEEALRAALDDRQSRMWTSAPGEIVSVDMSKQTATVKVNVKSFVKNEDGSQRAVELPLLQDVPLQFPGGGGSVMTFPVKPGDEVLVNFSSRSPDSWQQSGGSQIPTDASMHSLSNGFAMLGFRSNPKAIQGVSEDATEVRSDDGNTKISLSGAGGVGISTDKSVGINAASGVSISGGVGNVNFTGTLVVTGEIELNGIRLSTHEHTGVQTGGGRTEGPVSA